MFLEETTEKRFMRFIEEPATEDKENKRSMLDEIEMQGTTLKSKLYKLRF